jgi:hypothetical protein
LIHLNASRRGVPDAASHHLHEHAEAREQPRIATMREEAEARFRHLLERHDRELLRPLGPDARRALREQEWDRRFHETVERVVQPIMTRLRTLMHDHGLRGEITVTRRHTDADGKVTPSSIAFAFQVLTDPETHGFPITIPTLTLIGDAVHDAVQAHENSVLPFLGGHVGIVDQCPLERLDADFVEKHLFAIARKVLRGTDAQ